MKLSKKAKEDFWALFEMIKMEKTFADIDYNAKCEREFKEIHGLDFPIVAQHMRRYAKREFSKHGGY